MGSRPERVDGHIGTGVNEEGRKVVKFFFEGRISVAGNGSMMT